jgi:uncharacterized protein (TIGR00299 family) protein
MKVAYFDCQFGAAGDMLCASLFANGLDFQLWQSELRKIALPEGSFEVAVEDVMRCLVASKKIDVKCVNDHVHSDHVHSDHVHHDHVHHDHVHSDHVHNDHVHSDHVHHDHVHSEHTHEHAHDGMDSHHHEGEHGRSIREILSIIESSAISHSAKQLSTAIFKSLAVSEGRVHGVDPEEVHFHEVGAVDAIVDIVGFAIGYDLLGIEKSVVSPLTLGGGTVKTQHGLYPVPGPAVAYLVERAGAPTSAMDIRFECLTPTGAAILVTIAERWGGAPAFEKIESVGYGAGTLNPASHPNVVRTFVGQCSELKSASQSSNQSFLETDSVQSSSTESFNESDGHFRVEVIAVIEANIDDCPPNIIAYTLEKALAEGALDISVVPATMKKGRSGHLITVLAKAHDRRKMETLLLKETSSLGVRSYFVERLIAEREFAEVKLSDSWSIRVKIGRDLKGNIVNVQPEYADCATYAERHGLPLKEVFEKALAQYMASKSAD